MNDMPGMNDMKRVLGIYFVPPLQGGDEMFWHVTRAFSPGYHIPGLQPGHLRLCVKINP